MKKVSLAWVVCVASLCSLSFLAGCSVSAPSDKPKAEAKIDSIFNPSGEYVNVSIKTDPHNGIEYIEYDATTDYGGSDTLTPRLKANGKPYINPAWQAKYGKKK